MGSVNGLINHFWHARLFPPAPTTTWALLGAGSLVALLLVLSSVSDWNFLRAPLAHSTTANTDRETSITGNLRVHLWSWNPSAQIDGLTIRILSERGVNPCLVSSG